MLNQRVIRLFAPILVGLSSLVCTNNVQATAADARREALVIALAAAASGYHIESAIGSHYLKLGEFSGGKTVLSKGRSYKVIVGGCNDAYDLDLFVLDENKNIIGVDTDVTKHAVVDVQPKWTGNYYIIIKMTKGTPDGAHFSLMTAYK